MLFSTAKKPRILNMDLGSILVHMYTFGEKKCGIIAMKANTVRIAR